ncbi:MULTISPECIES: hypothetical protein [Streptomyces]|uniref:DNA primase/polymerase bifunctional N-terminal domain-containing protein n=2 Tax=Streptomyces TaxID=1883 RepID=A0ABT9LGQ0_STRGD|nr:MULTISPECIES: hypothetical protein [Streptomyces]MDP9682430.1 hypothetical protein [Streptomyces griseoviridis]GGS81491.1 hypothetical protein GCM10010240_13540 [Streptomyces griseoviridis]GGU18992.1 hypothetical protein GCM10010259_06690 [Streptomyces daghestanicus]GHI29637.1 hypothetical protein Sdagh_13670 [Streptomyces daghestanicus]
MAKNPEQRLPALRSVEAGPGVLVHPTVDQQVSAEEWLISAHPVPRQARAELREHGVVLLPLGGLFSAVRIPGRIVQALAASTDPADIDTVLTEVLADGPVICAVGGPRYYALVPPSMPQTWRDAAEDWRGDDVACLGRESYLGMPALAAVDYPQTGATVYWSVPPRPGILCEPLAVARLVAAGVHLLGDECDPWPANAPLTPHRGVLPRMTLRGI